MIKKKHFFFFVVFGVFFFEIGFEAFVGDGLLVPFRNDSFDLVISIAVLHHISTQERRLQAISECVRVCKPGTFWCIFFYFFFVLYF